MIIDKKVGLQTNRRKNVARVTDDRSREANSNLIRLEAAAFARCSDVENSSIDERRKRFALVLAIVTKN